MMSCFFTLENLRELGDDLLNSLNFLDKYLNLVQLSFYKTFNYVTTLQRNQSQKMGKFLKTTQFLWIYDVIQILSYFNLEKYKQLFTQHCFRYYYAQTKKPLFLLQSYSNFTQWTPYIHLSKWMTSLYPFNSFILDTRAIYSADLFSLSFGTDRITFPVKTELEFLKRTIKSMIFKVFMTKKWRHQLKH